MLRHALLCALLVLVVGASDGDFNERVSKKFAAEEEAGKAEAPKANAKSAAQQLREAAEAASASFGADGEGGAAGGDTSGHKGQGMEVILTDGSFASNLLIAPHFVKFFAPWCGHCKALAPEWTALAARLNVRADGSLMQSDTKTRIGSLDCDAHERTCKNFRITGFPRLVLIAMAKDDETGALSAEFVKYDGPRETAPMLEFVLKTPDVTKVAREKRAAVAAARKKAEDKVAALAAADEALAAAENPTRHTQIVTSSSFDQLFAAANATDSSSLLLHLFVPANKAAQTAMLDLREGTWKKLAAAVAQDDALAGSTVVGTLDCRAHPALCHEDSRLAMPRDVQWPQLLKLRRSNIIGVDFPGELYEGQLEDPLKIFAFAFGSDWATRAIKRHFPELKAKSYEETFPDMASSFRVWKRGKAALEAAGATEGKKGARAAAGAAFLEENAKVSGVATRADSKLQYRVLRSGEGNDHPAPDAECDVHYVGAHIGGTVFDSSFKRGEPSTFSPNTVVAGWREILQLMVEGDKFEIYLPPNLGYGDEGKPPQIEGGDVLVFQLELIAIKGERVASSKSTRVSGWAEGAKASLEMDSAEDNAAAQKDEL